MYANWCEWRVFCIVSTPLNGNGAHAFECEQFGAHIYEFTVCFIPNSISTYFATTIYVGTVQWKVVIMINLSQTKPFLVFQCLRLPLAISLIWCSCFIQFAATRRIGACFIYLWSANTFGCNRHVCINSRAIVHGPRLNLSRRTPI